MSIVPYFDTTTVKFTTPEDIQNALKNEQVKAVVNQHSSNFYTINIETAMQNLAQIGQLLRLAYASSKGFNCSSKVLSIFSNYQSLIKDSQHTSTTFVTATLSSLKFHTLAIKMAESDKLDKSITFISKCAQLAHQMAEESQKLVDKSSELVQQSHEALIAANDDENATTEQKKAVEKAIQDNEARQAAMESKRNDLVAKIEEERKTGADADRVASRARNRAFGLSLAGSIIPFLPTSKAVTHLNNEAERFEQKHDESLKRRAELQKMEIEAQASLMEAVSNLKNMKAETNDLANSIKSLELTVKTLGKVKTVFENSKLFWKGVESHCKSLAEQETLELLNDPDLKDELIDELKSSGLSWLALGKINYAAKQAITTVGQKVDSYMTHLPLASESPALVEEIVTSMEAQYHQEMSLIED